MRHHLSHAITGVLVRESGQFGISVKTVIGTATPFSGGKAIVSCDDTRNGTTFHTEMILVGDTNVDEARVPEQRGGTGGAAEPAAVAGGR